MREINRALAGSQRYEHGEPDYNPMLFSEPKLRAEDADGPDYGAMITGRFQLISATQGRVFPGQCVCCARENLPGSFFLSHPFPRPNKSPWSSLVLSWGRQAKRGCGLVITKDIE